MQNSIEKINEDDEYCKGILFTFKTAIFQKPFQIISVTLILIIGTRQGNMSME